MRFQGQLETILIAPHTADIETTNAADLAALKHYCKAHDIPPEEIEMHLADELPGDTPEWIAETAPMVAANTEEMGDTAIANGEILDDARQTLDLYPTATEHLRQAAERHRAEHVTTRANVRDNRQAYRTAQRARAAAQPSSGERVRSKLPFIVDPEISEYDGPAPEDIEGPFTEDALSPAVTDRRTAASIRGEFGDTSPTDYLVAAEDQANAAVKEAETIEELCESLRETPGAHKEVIDAMESPYTHLPEDMIPDGRDTTSDRAAGLSHDEERGTSLSR